MVKYGSFIDFLKQVTSYLMLVMDNNHTSKSYYVSLNKIILLKLIHNSEYIEEFTDSIFLRGLMPIQIFFLRIVHMKSLTGL